jgi:hypothetical protein
LADFALLAVYHSAWTISTPRSIKRDAISAEIGLLLRSLIARLTRRLIRLRLEGIFAFNLPARVLIISKREICYSHTTAANI